MISCVNRILTMRYWAQNMGYMIGVDGRGAFAADFDQYSTNASGDHERRLVFAIRKRN